MTKTCGSCNQVKDIDEFAFKSKVLGTRQSKCKSCTKEYGQQYYQDNKEAFAATTRKNRPSIKARNKEYLLNYLKTHPCVDCGEKDINVLEFDHKDMIGSKARRINGYLEGSLEKLQQEIAKCEVRCSNCHTRRTRKQMGWERTI